jgi:hypothetical protein
VRRETGDGTGRVGPSGATCLEGCEWERALGTGPFAGREPLGPEIVWFALGPGDEVGPGAAGMIGIATRRSLACLR